MLHAYYFFYNFARLHEGRSAINCAKIIIQKSDKATGQSFLGSLRVDSFLAKQITSNCSISLNIQLKKSKIAVGKNDY